MKLGTLNRWLRIIGLVLVIQCGEGYPTVLRIERAWRHPLQPKTS